MSNGVTVIGDVFPVERFETGLWSFDRALGFRDDNGVPLRSLFELYGFEHSGKSTLGLYLMAKIREDGTIWIADLEGTLPKDYVKEVSEHAGFKGTIRIADYINTDKRKKKLRSHEEQLQDAVDALLDDEVTACMVDSIGMFIPIVDSGKDLGERSVGQRAKTIADASRRILAWLRISDAPKLAIYINHVHPNIGGHGFDTPGGQTKKFAANVRVWLQRIENDVPSGTGNFLAEARVQKLKFGGTHGDRKGLVYFIPGYGVSKEMTDVFDCIGQGLAKREAVIKLKQYDNQKGDFVWNSMGRIGDIAEKALEPEKNEALFAHFAEALKGLDSDG